MTPAKKRQRRQWGTASNVAPKLLDEVLIERVSSVVKIGMHASRAAAACGISGGRHETWLAKGRAEPGSLYGAYVAAIEAAEAEAELSMVHDARREGRERKTTLAVLSKRFPERWGGTVKVEHSGPEGGPVELGMSPQAIRAVLDALTDEQLNRLGGGNAGGGSAGGDQA